MEPEVAAVWRRANEVAAIIEQWVRVRDKKSIRLSFKKEDQVRLLRLCTWEFRYKLPIGDILDFVMPVLRSRVRRVRAVKKASWGLGVSVRSLVGPGAKRILEEQIEQLFPGGEHIRIWRDQERSRQLAVEQAEETDGVAVRQAPMPFTVLDSPTVEEFIAGYRARIARARGSMLSYSKTRARKPYRGNPWR